MPSFKIPTPLRPYAGNQSVVEVAGNTVGEALDDLTAQFSGLRQHLFSSPDELRGFVNIFLNQEEIRQLQGFDTPLNEDSILRIIPSVAGG